MEYDIQTTILVHALEDHLVFVEPYLKDLTLEELDQLNDALDRLAPLVDQESIRRAERRR